MQLILVRHGNTFGPGDAVVWAGAAQDLPLVERGIEQGRAVGAWLSRQGVEPTAVYCGPLQRTRGSAALILDELDLPQPVSIQVESALNEIDYGAWGGRTTADVVQEYGAEAMDAWNTQGVMPEGAGFAPSVDELRGEALHFVASLQTRYGSGDSVVLVSSNGRLRWFLGLVSGALAAAFEQGTAKMLTGHVSLLELDSQGAWTVKFWNRDPAGMK